MTQEELAQKMLAALREMGKEEDSQFCVYGEPTVKWCGIDGCVNLLELAKRVLT